MKSFYINPATNDIEFDGSNNFKMIDGDEELIQCVRLIIATNLGEWFLNTGYGFRHSAVQGKGVNDERVTEELYAAVLQEERVATVENIKFEIDKATRKMTVYFTFRKKVDNEILEGAFTI